MTDADAVVVNPAVKPGHPLVELARDRGTRVTSEIELFLEACPARVIGVTGSNGKSTTAAMIAAIGQAGGRRTWLGGNIGGSLLDDVDAMTAADMIRIAALMNSADINATDESIVANRIASALLSGVSM